MTQTRYHELDWLRVILIFAVFIHHVGMPFNGDGFHIMNQQSSKLLDNMMVYFEQFRLPMLFLIAGCASMLFLNAKGHRKFIQRRVMRLLVPLVFAVVVIVPPQNFIEHINEHQRYIDAWPGLVLQLQTNHLWFIQFLMVFALVGVPIHLLLQRKTGQKCLNQLDKWLTKPLALLSLVLVFIVLKVTLKTNYPDDSKSLGNLSITLFYGFCYLVGMLLISRQSIWQKLSEHRRKHLLALITATFIFYGYYFSPDLSAYLSLPQRWIIWWAVCAAVTWTGALTLLGYGQHYLNRPKNWLSHCNTMIYPFYILHQTVIVLIAYPIVQWQASIMVKMSSLLALSLSVTILCCALLIYPFNFMRFLVGVRPIPAPSSGAGKSAFRQGEKE